MAIKTRATSNFSFKKLLDNLDDVVGDYFEDSYEDLAESARNAIKNSTGLRKLTKGTIEIRKKGLSKKGFGMPTTSTTPLLHTGNLLRSIKATKKGVEMVDYGKHHMEGFTIVENKWTKKFAPRAIGKQVKPRNPFFTNKGNLKKDFTKGREKRVENLIKKINKVWRV